MQSSLETRNVSIYSRRPAVVNKRTSIRLEPSLWKALEDIAQSAGKSVSEIVTDVYHARPDRGGLTSAVRVHIVAELQRRAEMSERVAA